MRYLYLTLLLFVSQLAWGQANYHIYIENSGSMDGYVKGETAFKTAIYDFIVNMLNQNVINETDLRFYYINSAVIPDRSNARGFIADLTPASFKAKGGKRTNTDLSKIFETVLDRTTSKDVSILVSDCVFSPGAGKNAAEYLNNQQISIKRIFGQKLDAKADLTSIVLQLNSNFDGNYYNQLNSPQKINAQRPYYIWIVGGYAQVLELFNNIDKTTFKGGGVKHSHCFFNADVVWDYKMTNGNRLGSFSPDRQLPKSKFVNAKKETKGPNAGKFRFAVGINLKTSLFDDAYIQDPTNYTINRDYTIEVKKMSGGEFTHLLILTTTRLKTETVTIRLNKKAPTWLAAVNSINDTDINAPGEMGKTFGIKSLIDGVSEAYSSTSKKTNVFELNISINQ